jgi:hypothetical protein
MEWLRIEGDAGPKIETALTAQCGLTLPEK